MRHRKVSSKTQLIYNECVHEVIFSSFGDKFQSKTIQVHTDSVGKIVIAKYSVLIQPVVFQIDYEFKLPVRLQHEWSFWPEFIFSFDISLKKTDIDKELTIIQLESEIYFGEPNIQSSLKIGIARLQPGVYNHIKLGTNLKIDLELLVHLEIIKIMDQSRKGDIHLFINSINGFGILPNVTSKIIAQSSAERIKIPRSDWEDFITKLNLKNISQLER